MDILLRENLPSKKLYCIYDVWSAVTRGRQVIWIFLGLITLLVSEIKRCKR